MEVVYFQNVLERAIDFANHAHRGAVRRRENLPYIIHPMEVTTIASSLTHDQEVLAAAMLHDTVEDTDVTAEQISDIFGSRVAALVASETENKRPDIPAHETWRLRKEESLRELAEADDIGVKILWLSDKLSNMRSFYRLWQQEGEDMWRTFHQHDHAQHAWYYRSVMRLTRDLCDTDAWIEYHRLVETVFGDVKEE